MGHPRLVQHTTWKRSWFYEVPEVIHARGKVESFQEFSVCVILFYLLFKMIWLQSNRFHGHRYRRGYAVSHLRSSRGPRR